MKFIMSLNISVANKCCSLTFNLSKILFYFCIIHRNTALVSIRDFFQKHYDFIKSTFLNGIINVICINMQYEDIGDAADWDWETLWGNVFRPHLQVCLLFPSAPAGGGVGRRADLCMWDSRPVSAHPWCCFPLFTHSGGLRPPGLWH